MGTAGATDTPHRSSERSPLTRGESLKSPSLQRGVVMESVLASRRPFQDRNGVEVPSGEGDQAPAWWGVFSGNLMKERI